MSKRSDAAQHVVHIQSDSLLPWIIAVSADSSQYIRFPQDGRRYTRGGHPLTHWEEKVSLAGRRRKKASSRKDLNHPVVAATANRVDEEITVQIEWNCEDASYIGAGELQDPALIRVDTVP
ncbi:hypothetical protein GCM10010339_71170 [Streptomyces alanosinicus]|uniref:Uncharacterized protein n=1 Tax=Streptomyces alanosinicus TaxID=68171 RepID=A0A918YP63_9ACTN|nr:hypothetical protein GCM10010339_71170 [Streptomyces alanosinicus]